MDNPGGVSGKDAVSLYEYRLLMVERKVDIVEKKYDQILGRMTGLLIAILVGTFSIIGTVVASHLMTLAATTK